MVGSMPRFTHWRLDTGVFFSVTSWRFSHGQTLRSLEYVQCHYPGVRPILVSCSEKNIILKFKDKKISHWESVFFSFGQENNFLKDLSLDKKRSSRVVSVTVCRTVRETQYNSTQLIVFNNKSTACSTLQYYVLIIRYNKNKLFINEW